MTFAITPEEEMMTSIPVTVAYQAPAPVAADFIVGDTVQMIRDASGEPLETAVGVVAGVGVTALTLGTRTFDPVDGWQFALVSRPLAFPTTLCEIDATVQGATVRLMGKGDLWMDAQGVAVAPTTITAFTAI
jgi:hypothetical protein